MPTTIPTDPLQLQELLGDESRLQDVFAEGQLGELIASYARTVLDKDLSIAAQVREQTASAIAEFLSSDDLKRPDLSPGQLVRAAGGGRPALHNPRAMGAALDGDFASASDYFRTIWHNAPQTADRQARMARIRAAFSSTVPSEGGFLIPEVLRSEILSVALESSIMRSRARVIPMDSLRVPFPAIDSAGQSSSVHGGVVAYWAEEGSALTASNPAFGRIVLEAKKLTAYTQIPNELISDSAVSLDAYVNQLFPEALAFYEDAAFLTGSGVGEPLGVLNTSNPATVVVPKESGQAAGTVKWENIVKMFSRMLPSSMGRAVWIASHDTFPQLATMGLAVGTGGSAVWLGNGVAAPPVTILGRPVVFTEKTPGVLGAQGDITFVDPGYYLIGDRQVMSAMSSPHFAFSSDQTAYRITQRVDGRPWLQNTITPKNGGPTLSPIVQLAVRA